MQVSLSQAGRPAQLELLNGRYPQTQKATLEQQQ